MRVVTFLWDGPDGIEMELETPVPAVPMVGERISVAGVKGIVERHTSDGIRLRDVDDQEFWDEPVH